MKLGNLKNFLSANFLFFASFVFLIFLTLINSNMLLLLSTFLYLIIMIYKLQNYRLALFNIFILLIPFTLGRNILEIVLINKREIYGYSLFDVTYFISIFISDIILLLIYQNYISNKISQKKELIRLPKNIFIASIFLSIFNLIIFLTSLKHEFGQLVLFNGIVFIKYILIFLSPYIISFNKNKNGILQIIFASSLFQSLLIILEQIKKGNLGLFIENTLPGFEFGTLSSESTDLLRANGTFNEPNIAAIFLLMNFSVLLYSFVNSVNNNNKSINILNILGFLIILMAIIFTGSRSLYILTFLTTVFIILLNLQKIKIYYKKIIKNNFIKIILVAIFVLTFPYIYNRIDSVKDVLTEKGSISYRQELNRHSLILSKQNLMGIGINLTPYYLAKNYKTTSSDIVNFDQAPAHNMFIQIITEEGILGLIFFILFLFFSYKRFVVKEKTINEYAISSCTFLLASLFHPAFTTHPEIFSFFILYLSFANVISK